MLRNIALVFTSENGTVKSKIAYNPQNLSKIYQQIGMGLCDKRGKLLNAWNVSVLFCFIKF